MTKKLITLLKIILCLPCCLIVSGILQTIGIIVYELNTTGTISLNTPQDYSAATTFISSLLGLIGTLLVIHFFIKFSDKDFYSPIGLNTKGKSKNILMGFLVVTIIMSIGFSIMYFSNNILLEHVQFNWTNISIYFIAFICVAFMEEILFRGYILSHLMKITNRFSALVISSIIFALMHSFNPDMSLLPIINLFLAGMMLGASYIYTRNLWFPFSLHLFWNFIQGPILGFNVSGLNTNSIFKLYYPYNNIINGGAFGFEGSIICLILLTIATYGIILYHKNIQEHT